MKAMHGYNMLCTYLAHHELESILITFIMGDLQLG